MSDAHDLNEALTSGRDGGTAGAHGTVGHGGGGHGGGGAAHGEEPLGPVDVVAWGAGLLGVAIGLVMAFAFALATSGF